MNCLHETVQRSAKDGRLYVVGYYGGQLVYVRPIATPQQGER